MKKIIILLFVVFISAFAQEPDYEALHKLGRDLYIHGDPSAALDVYQQILNNYPDDVDALLYRGRLFARLELYDLAEKELLRTLELAPDYMDAYYALASVYYWSGRLDRASTVLTEWITRDIQNPDAYILSARVAIANRRYAAARTFIEQARDFGADPAVIENVLAMLQTPNAGKDWEAGVGYEYLAVDQGRPDWQQGKIYLSHDFGKIIAIAEVNRYRRNDANDHTLVLDTYYDLWKKTYMNTRIQIGLNRAFMPVLDLTAEMFHGLGTRHEPALGYRLMHYGDVTAHIPSVAWAMYPGKWYVREKLSMVITTGISWQNQLTARYYLKDVDSYLQVMNVLGTDFNVMNSIWMQSLSFALSASTSVGEHWILSGVASWTRDEYQLNRAGVSAGIAYRW